MIQKQSRVKSTKKLSKQPKNKEVSDSYHHGQLKEALLQTALKLLKIKSPNEISLRELARVAGVSGTAPYRHFKDKNELLAAISQQGFELMSKYMMEAMESAGQDPLKMFYNCGLAYFKMGLEHQQHFKLMVNSEIIPCKDYPELLQSSGKAFLLVKKMVEFCQSKGLLGKGDSNTKALHCWSVVNGFTALYAEERLDWIGVTSENAECAIKSLMSQFLIGTEKPLTSSDFGFKPFETVESLEIKKIMDQLCIDLTKR